MPPFVPADVERFYLDKLFEFFVASGVLQFLSIKEKGWSGIYSQTKAASIIIVNLLFYLFGVKILAELFDIEFRIKQSRSFYKIK